MSRKPEAEGHTKGVERSCTTNKDNARCKPFFFSSMLEEILDYRNITKALKQVISNKGAGGVDGMQTDKFRDWLEANWTSWKQSILEGSYRPDPVRKVEIPKAQGGTRMLGIPTVKDRLLGQAIQQWLSPQYEPGFSENSYGFREGRNAHQAVGQAKKYLDEGKVWIVELDLDKFFDRVNHDKLMGLLAKRIADKGTLKLIRSYLNSGIMEGGLVSPRTEGTPQGSPLSPLMSNILLDELDKELEARGHSFVRYADDLSVYVKSEKSAQRVLESITEYIEKKLKLKVNREKTQVSQPEKSTLLGFSFYRSKDKWEIKIAPKSLRRIKEKIKAKTKRNDPSNAKEKIKKLEAMIEGWVNYFRIARVGRTMQMLDKLTRTRIRMGIWKQWKTSKTRVKNLTKLGVSKSQSHLWGNSSLSYCRIAHSKIMCVTVNNERLQRLGYVGFYNYYYWKTGHQGKLF
ncbi:group II intron reverse transcriptase/maturase [Flavitalea flava]